ncbi:hypothetical protein CLAFUW4_03383 [Fulvia fulva]|uniref:Uncharacterized protein n=1 Tax=Passalora fulva TaxID=5499 RepID=A0A9Q8LBI5_PASFU|nr:uncharacterized protein CLAFUR5_03363 [Fulvia fulva]KAK4632023.1 hypothetical protein CLAFUR4_03372 [Fulvia fulva]KAK4633142.1 hypothetical protein CLAFUR0_03377 [Fulvia fulva]UJO14367.1 hypothetical protein CLAFUR5_03363 [Fulvia fulva]WPV11708.1 hypothetical protein CLAFUW4_03383 [Fulvia fulva]WPV26140.1 hypothetical protein CLAFUW7_03375 [Fulvia fulva]
MATSRREELLRLKRTDHKTEHLVLHVADHSTSPDTLDLKLVGTDTERLYHGNVEESSLETLQASNFKGNLAEFKTVLSYALLHQLPKGPFPDVLEGVETVAAVDIKTFTVTIRKNISGITQKLAAIKLEEDTGNIEVNFIGWTDEALIDRDDLRARLADTEEHMKEQQAQVAQLSAELDKLVKAKKQHEEEMLSKFAALLNAKKLKIRDQQRLLSSAKVDFDAVEEVEQARLSNGTKRVGASRKGKRKAHGTVEPAAPEVEDEGEDDATADGTDDAQEEDRRRQETPETDEEDLADEDLDVEGDSSGMATAIDDSQTTRRVATKATRKGHRGQRSSQKINADKQKSPSPQRKLPSRKAKSPAKEPTPPAPSNDVDDVDDDETDDEL